MTFVREGWNWYVAQLVQEVCVRSPAQSLVLIESVLLEAPSPDAAFMKCVEICSSTDHVYRNNEGAKVSIRYVGVHDLDNLQVEELHDGVILSVRRADCDGDAAQLVRPRAALTLFRGSRARIPHLD